MMKKFIAAMSCIAMLSTCALAEGERSFVVENDAGSMLITDGGQALTNAGDYGYITPITFGDCPAERMLFSVSEYDLSSGFFLDDYSGDDYEDEADWGEGWEAELDDVEAWPEGEGGLDEGYDMEIVEDMEWSDTDGELITDAEFGEGFADELPDDFADGMTIEFPEADFEGFDVASAFGADMAYGVALMNARGEVLTGFDYTSFQHDVENAVVIAYDFEGFAYALNEQGQVLASGNYSAIVSDGAGGFFAVQPAIDPDTGDWSEEAPLLHISSSGEVAQTGFTTFSYELLPGFADGLMCVAVSDAGAVRYVYIDQNGGDAFGKSFDYASSFAGGCAEVLDENYVARLIDTTGNYMTEKNYIYFEFSADGDGMPIIGNLAEGGFDLISREDRSVIASFLPENGDTTMYAYHSGDRLIMAYSDSEMLIIDAAGNVLYRGAEDVYAYTWYAFCDSQPQRLLVTRGEGAETESCIADFSGNAIGGWYDEITALSWIGGEGRYLVCNYDFVEVYYDDTVGMEPDPDSYRFGVVDQDGNEVIPMNYEFFDCLSADRYWVSDGVSYQLLDGSGSVLAEFPIE